MAGNKLKRRGAAAAGAAASISAFLTFGVAPIAAAPTVHADVPTLDWLVDVVDPATVAGVADASTAIDGGSWLSPLDLNWLAPTASWWALPGAGDALPATDWVDVLNQWIYQPWYDSMQDWFRSDLGQAVSGFLNQVSGQYLIGDGANGTIDNPDGGNGGLWFGDGGDGYGASGNGGNAGWFFGNGGDAGSATDTAAAGDGTGEHLMLAAARVTPIDGTPGRGGDGAFLFGNGGNGTNGGDGQFGGNGGAGGAGGPGACSGARAAMEAAAETDQRPGTAGAPARAGPGAAVARAD